MATDMESEYDKDEAIRRLEALAKDLEEEEYSRAYSRALQKGEAKNNGIPIMLVGQHRGGKTSLMRRLFGLPFNKDEPSTTGIDVNVIELTKQNAEDPWKKKEEEFLTNEGEAKAVLYKKTAEYFDRGVHRNLEGDAPEPLNPVMPVKLLLREEISKIKSQRSTEHDQQEVLRLFVSDFAGQSIYYDIHGCFVKPHCPYVLVHDLSLEFDKPAVPMFKASYEEEEIEMNNPHLTTNLDNFTSWLKFLQGLGECQDKQFPDRSRHCTTAKGENFELPPVLIALTNSDKVKGNDVQNRINKILCKGKYKNVVPEFFQIDNTLKGDEGDDVRKLRGKLFDLSNSVLNQEILMPVKWLNFEVPLIRKLSPDCKYIPVNEAKQEAEACGVEFDQAIKFLHLQGVVVHHSGSSKVVLDPHWLMNLFTKVISVPGKLDALSGHALDVFKQKGILFREYLQELKDAELLEELMQKFNLICPCQHEGKASFYVPSVAPAMKPGKELEASNVPSLFVTFPRKLVPMGLFTKLQVRLISEWEKRFHHQQVKPSFYCNYSFLPLIIDGDVYDVYLIDLHEVIKVVVFPKQDGNHFTFASHLLATLKKCLDDLKSPDQLLFSMTSYDFEVKCTCCFGKEERKCSRHHEIQCHSDRCHGHFLKLSELQDSVQPFVVCQSNKHSSKVFDIKSVKIWLSTVPDTAMVEDSSKFGWPSETSSEASSSGSQSTGDSYLKLSMNDLNERENSGNVNQDIMPAAETKPRHEEIHEDDKRTWFKNTFVDSKRKLRKGIHEELRSFPWLCGAYGLVGSNKKIPRPHLYLTVKRGVKISVARRELEEKFKCDDAKEHFELLREPERKPKIKYLGHLLSKLRCKLSKLRCKSSSVSLTPGGRVLACSDPTNQNPLRIPEENEKDDVPQVQGTGTLTMFCALNGQHYALTCYHICCATDENRFNAAFNKVEDVQKMRNALPAYESFAKKQQYYFTEGNTENDNEPILFGDDGTNYTHLGGFGNYHFDNECDILSLKVSDGIDIDCKIADATSPDWDSIWDELYESGHNPVEVQKIGFSSELTRGYIVRCDFSYSQEQEPLFQDAFVVKGCGGPFLEGGDSGSLVFFHDKNNQKHVFAYGVCEVDELLLPEQHESASSDEDENGTESEQEIEDEHETTYESSEAECKDEISECKDEWQDKDKLECEEEWVVFQEESESNIWEKEMERKEERNSKKKVKASGPYFICLRLDTALENLGLEKATCFHNCGCN